MLRDDAGFVDRRIGPRRRGVGRRISGDRREERPAHIVGGERRAGERRNETRRSMIDRRTIPEGDPQRLSERGERP
jgi:hypothetical protein